MSQATPVSGKSTARERIIVALDVPTEAEARQVVGEVGDSVGAFKIGMQLFTAAGPSFVRELTESGLRIFLDLKFHDIPNTVASAGIEAAKLGVWMFNVHASGGRDMMQRTVEAVEALSAEAGIPKPLIIGVTLLTSSADETLRQTGISGSINDHVSRLAKLADEARLDGVVASAREVPLIHEAVDRQSFLTVTPGIRSAAATPDDQRRVTTIGDAFANGSSYVVIGRPILASRDRKGAVQMIIEEAERAGERSLT